MDKDLIDMGVRIFQLFGNDLPFKQPSGGEVGGDIRIGRVKNTRVPFGINLEELQQHLLLMGRAGSGKTTIFLLIMLQLLEKAIPFLAFDFKKDYRHLLRICPDLVVLKWEDLLYNPLRPPLGCPPTIWIQIITNIFCQAYWLMQGTKGLIQNKLFQLFQDYGVFDGKDTYPTLHDLFQILDKHSLQRQTGRDANFLESAQNRVDECLKPLGRIFDCDRGHLIEDLLTRPVILELDGLLYENQIFLTTTILRHTFQYRISNNQRGPLKHVNMFDEGGQVFGRDRDHIQGLGINEVAQLACMIREFGEALVVAEQMPTELSDAIAANTYTKIALSQSGGKNIKEVGASMTLCTQQEGYVPKLLSDPNSNTFEAVVRINNKWPEPFVIEIVPFQIPKDVSDRELEHHMRPALEHLQRTLIPRTPYNLILQARRKDEERKIREEEMRTQATSNQPQQTRKSEDDEILVQILITLRKNPFMDQKEIISTLNLTSSASKNTHHFQELLFRGFVHTHRIGFGRGRSTKAFYEITEQGREYARIQKFTIPGKGDFKHKLWQHLIHGFYQSMGCHPEIEKTFENKSVDVALYYEGRRTAVEIELSSANLLGNIRKDLDAGCEKVIVAVNTQRTIATYKKIIMAEKPELLKQVEFRVLTDYLP
jgi:hypothetical protein